MLLAVFSKQANSFAVLRVDSEEPAFVANYHKSQFTYPAQITHSLLTLSSRVVLLEASKLESQETRQLLV